MAMSTGASNGDADAPMLEMNMTPLIDVMLVLIIMFIITIPIQNHTVEMTMPQPSPPQSVAKPPTAVTIDVTEDGMTLWDGTVVPSASALEDKLRLIAQESDQADVRIRAHRAASYRSVAAVLSAAQRLGVVKLGLVGNEQYL